MVDVTALGVGHGARISLTAGGSAVNAAIWAAIAGADATVVGRVGDDLGGRALRTELQERGVGADFSVDSEAATGTFLVIGRRDSRRSGRERTLRPDHLPDRLEADVVLVSGLPARPDGGEGAGARRGNVARARTRALDPLRRRRECDSRRRDRGPAAHRLAPEEAARMLGEPFPAGVRDPRGGGAVGRCVGRLETKAEPFDNGGPSAPATRSPPACSSRWPAGPTSRRARGRLQRRWARERSVWRAWRRERRHARPQLGRAGTPRFEDEALLRGEGRFIDDLDPVPNAGTRRSSARRRARADRGARRERRAGAAGRHRSPHRRRRRDDVAPLPGRNRHGVPYWAAAHEVRATPASRSRWSSRATGTSPRTHSS